MAPYIVFFGLALNLYATAGYVIEMVKGKAKPNRITSGLWALEGGIAFFASLAAGVTWAAVPVFVAFFGPALCFVLSYLLGQAYWKLTRFDWACGAFSVLALVFWKLTGDPNIAIVFAILADFAASLPTVKKSWHNPESEAVVGYAPCVVGYATSFAALEHYSFAEIAFPAYAMAICAYIAGVIFFGQRAQRKKARLAGRA